MDADRRLDLHALRKKMGFGPDPVWLPCSSSSGKPWQSRSLVARSLVVFLALVSDWLFAGGVGSVVLFGGIR